MNFIKTHLIAKIEEQVKHKQAVLKHNHFYYFDKPIIEDKKIFDRINRFNPYRKNEILPSSYYSLKGATLVEIFKQLKSNDFFIYKNIDGKSYKTRIKKDADKRS